MRALVDLPPCTLRITAPWPDDALGFILPPPPPGWHDTVRRELGDYLATEAEDALQDRGAEAGVEIVLTADGPERATVLWQDRHGTGEHVGALLEAVLRVMHDRTPAGIRFAKRAADRQAAERFAAGEVCA